MVNHSVVGRVNIFISIYRNPKYLDGKVHVNKRASNASYMHPRYARLYVILRELFTGLHPVTVLATPAVCQSCPKCAVQNLMMFAFLNYSKFLAGDVLGRSSLVADGSNRHRIAVATCYRL